MLKAIGFALIALLLGMALGGVLGLTVIGPEMQKLNLDFWNHGNQENTGDTDNNQNGNQSKIINNNPTPSNPTNSYGGSGQFDITITVDGNTFSGTMTANINCPVQLNGNNIQLSLSITPTSVSGSLQQVVRREGETVLNFAGTTSNSQISANAKGTTGSDNSGTFDLNLSGTIQAEFLTFTITSASDSQIKISTSQPIILQPNN